MPYTSNESNIFLAIQALENDPKLSNLYERLQHYIMFPVRHLLADAMVNDLEQINLPIR